jgi:hypothetical protein
MPTIKCPYIMCKYNSCDIPKGKGKCQKEGLIELKIKDIHEIPGFKDDVPVELENERLMDCCDFVYDEGKNEKINKQINKQ